MLNILIIGAGGFLGAIARYVISTLVHRMFITEFPAGTFVVNVLGSFVIGVIMYLAQHETSLSPQTKLFLTIGIVGAFTTFSTFSLETLALINSRSNFLALINVLGNVLLGLFAVWGGFVLTRYLRA